MSTPDTTTAVAEAAPAPAVAAAAAPAVAPQAAPDLTPPPAEITSLDGWKANKYHIVTLPSGSKVKIQCPDLPNMIRLGQIPNALIEAAIDVANGKKITAEDIKEQAEFYNTLVELAVVEPQVTAAEVADGLLPTEDKEYVVELAARQRDFDAIGHHIGGLETIAEFRNFRGLLPLDAYGGGV